MLYSTDENKGTEYGLEALKKCHDVFPKLKVELFGVYSKPLGLPDWMHYNQNPVDLCSIYNSTAIFLLLVTMKVGGFLLRKLCFVVVL